MKMKKALVALVCAIALVTATFLGTMAYFTSKDSVTNTFTVGKVGIILDEAKVNIEGKKLNSNNEVAKEGDTLADRVKGNTYHLIPGQSYTKDPTVTVEEGSEDCYVRMFVEVNYSSQLDAIFAPSGANLLDIFAFNTNDSKWEYKDNVEDESANTRTYEFWYKTKVENAGKLDPLFESFTVPQTLTNEQLATLVTLDNDGKITNQLKFNVTAHAIQAAGFADAEAAWAAWN